MKIRNITSDVIIIDNIKQDKNNLYYEKRIK